MVFVALQDGTDAVTDRMEPLGRVPVPAEARRGQHTPPGVGSESVYCAVQALRACAASTSCWLVLHTSIVVMVLRLYNLTAVII